MTVDQLLADISDQFPGAEFYGEPMVGRDDDGAITSITVRHSMGETTWMAPGPDREPDTRGSI